MNIPINIVLSYVKILETINDVQNVEILCNKYYNILIFIAGLFFIAIPTITVLIYVFNNSKTISMITLLTFFTIIPIFYIIYAINEGKNETIKED